MACQNLTSELLCKNIGGEGGAAGGGGGGDFEPPWSGAAMVRG